MQHVRRAFIDTIQYTFKSQFENFLKIRTRFEPLVGRHCIHSLKVSQLPSSQKSRIKVQQSAAFSITKKRNKNWCSSKTNENELKKCWLFDIILYLMGLFFPFRYSTFTLNGWKILCASIKWRIKQTSPRCLNIFPFCIIFHEQWKQWQQICSIEIGISARWEMKIGIAGRRERERKYQNGSRDISYLIKLDCVHFLIGLKL